MTKPVTPTSQQTICGGSLTLTVTPDTSTVSGKFTGIKVSNICATCPFIVLCHLQYTKDPNKPKREPRPLTPKPEQPVVTGPTVLVVAFTGMPIGRLEVISNLKDTIEVETKGKQVLIFSKDTGVQLNCKNPKYANRVDVKEVIELEQKEA
jgi:hypothetical protein